MAAANRISGKDLYISFADADISADFTSVSFAEEGDLVDLTAADDAFHYYVSLARKDGTLDYEGFYDGATETAWDAVAVNTAGTLIIGPKGTAGGAQKYTWTRAIAQSRSMAIPFDDGVKVTATFQFSSAVSETTY